MTVYVLLSSVDYEGNDVWGIFSTPELAMAAVPGSTWQTRTFEGETWWACAHPPEHCCDDLFVRPFTLDDFTESHRFAPNPD